MRYTLSLLLVLLFAAPAFADITLNGGNWSTTFDGFSECTQRNGCPSTSPDGVRISWGSACVDGNCTSFTPSANNPGGTGNGARFWIGDGTNVYSGPINISFPNPLKEFWIRWYFRYEKGFKWSHLSYDKQLYIYSVGATQVIPEFYGNAYRVAGQGGSDHVIADGAGWDDVYGTTSDGSWHCFELHLKMDTNSSNGVVELWLDGNLQVKNTSVNLSGGDASARGGWNRIDFQSNESSPGNGQAMYVDYDDIAISTTGRIGLIGGSSAGSTTPPPTTDPGSTTSDSGSASSGTTPSSQVLFEEKFEDTNFSGRGWYDNTNLTLSSTEAVAGSSKSAEFHFLQGATKPTSGAAIRKAFADTDSVYVSYYVKYSANWEGSNKSYHPHEFYLMTNEDGDYAGLANTYLTTYIEQNEGVPVLSLQDGKNIDQSRIGQDLTNVTESRSVAGCNGDSDGYGSGYCYDVGGGVYNNGKEWRASKTYFSDSAGPYYKNDWHKVEAYIKLNSIANGKAVADGVLQYWFDGQPVLNNTNVVLRTGAHPNMKFNKIIIGPWIGDGSPVDQTFWVDNLTVATARPGNTLSPPRILLVD